MSKIFSVHQSHAYLKGVSWFLLSLVINVINDLIAKYTGAKLGSAQVCCFRFMFSTLTLLPFIYYYGFNQLKSTNLKIHFARGALLFAAISAWTYGLSMSLISTATAISFIIPIFVLVLAIFFLKENVKWYRWIATILGFIGIIIILKPSSEKFNFGSQILLLSALGFATLDIINKKFIVQESTLSMIFYSSLFTFIISLPVAWYSWQPVSLSDLALLFLLGINANLLLYCLLKSFAFIDATATAPYRYFELTLSSITGFILFKEIPHSSTWYGAIILIFSTAFVVYQENAIKIYDHDIDA